MNQIKKNGFLKALVNYNCSKHNIVGAKYWGGSLVQLNQEILWSNKSFLFARRLLDRKVIQKLSYFQQKKQQYLHALYDGSEFGDDTYIIQYIKQ